MDDQAFVFPGQGSQSVGMGLELFNTSSAAREIFEEADESLGFHQSKLIFEGPANELQATVNSQPAIMTVSIACLKAWEEFWGPETPQPASMAGHSLGEFTAIVAAGVLTFSEGVKLVQKRGQLMHQASISQPGGMAAIIGLDELTLNNIASETNVEIANINSSDQIVVSGDNLSIARAMELASSRGARKTIPLAVSGAFHSQLMRQAGEGLAEALAELNLNEPKVPIIANSSSKPMTSIADINQELVRGLCECVQWKSSVQFMINSGISRFVEFGPTPVLSRLIKRIDPEVEAVTMSDLTSMRKMVGSIA
jgi:[acyl-carrier-protein] S-malonyltransferase